VTKNDLLKPSAQKWQDLLMTLLFAQGHGTGPINLEKCGGKLFILT